jgi:hypothetical protein
LRRILEQKNLTGNLYLAQGVFLQPALLSFLPESSELFGLTGKEQAVLPGVNVDGVGIPDLIRIAVEGPNILLEVGDIKSVAKPRYHQKWQVAFYAFLLKSFLVQERLDTKGVQVADSGFLLIRSPLDDKPQRHTFALQPYLASLPALLRNFAHFLSHSPDQAGWQIQAHCLSCLFFPSCYQQALHEEDIQFIPRLSQGALEKMRALSLRNIEEASAWFADDRRGESLCSPLPTGQAQGPAPTTCTVNTDFSPAQREGLHNAVTALQENKIILTRQRTELFPAHIATCFFVHLLNDPVTMLPKALGLGVGQHGQGAEDLQIFTWVVGDKTAQAERQKTWQNVWYDFSVCFLDLWQEAVEKQGRPHIFFFGAGIRQGLDDWAAMMADKPLRNLFRRSLASSYPFWTDLEQVLHKHFALPVPATLTLYDLACVLGLSRGDRPVAPTALPTPESLVHFDPLPDTVDTVMPVKAFLCSTDLKAVKAMPFGYSLGLAALTAFRSCAEPESGDAEERLRQGSDKRADYERTECCMFILCTIRPGYAAWH